MQMRCRGAEVQRCRSADKVQRCRGGTKELQKCRCRGAEVQNARRYDGDAEVQRCSDGKRCYEVVQRRCRGLEV